MQSSLLESLDEITSDDIMADNNADNGGNDDDDEIELESEESESIITKKDENVTCFVDKVVERKVTLNVGGKKFALSRKVVDYLHIMYNKLHKVVKNDKVSYFLDRDPYYFGKIINLIRVYGFDRDKFLLHIDDFSDQLLSEMCLYEVIDKKFKPRAKIRLSRKVTFPSRHNEIITIVAENQLFETLSTVLSKSNYFDVKLKMNRSKKFYLTDVDSKIFRYVLNLLRIGELYVSSADIVELLDNYGIEYEKLETKKIVSAVISNYVEHNSVSDSNQVVAMMNFLDPRANKMVGFDKMYQFIDNKYYYPEAMFVCPHVENTNVVTTSSVLAFDSDIIFRLDNGDCIEDLLLCIDIPVLKASEMVEYIDLVEYKIIESIKLITNNGTEIKTMLETNSCLLYLYPLIYTNNGLDYHNITQSSEKKFNLMYNNDLIEIYRITLPLFLFRDNHILPVTKMKKNNISAILSVKIAQLQKIFKNNSKIKDIPLLNVFLISNYVTLAPSMIMQGESKSMTSEQINAELLDYPIMYMYNKIHFLSLPIQSTSNIIFDTVTVPLDMFGLIKDFFFVIISKDDYIENRIDKFTDALIEIEIFELLVNDLTHEKTFNLYNKIDSVILNKYEPLKRLGHLLPNGIYYHSFSANPKCSQIIGGLIGKNFFIQIKVKKMDGIINFYINEYHKEIF